MRLSRHNINKGLRRLSVFLFALWLNGAGCLFCCGRDLPDAANVPALDAAAAVVADERVASSAADPHSCCRARVKNRAAVDTKRNSQAQRPAGSEPRASHDIGGAGASGCCERAGQVMAEARKQRALSGHGVGSKGDGALHSSTTVFTASASPFRVYSANRRETHLRCCIFLI